ncbi:MAG: 4-hydroxy-tetrahydrodipicolinate synthase, partial [Thermomicrobiales bacterium]|nr:4-hydroxy-tetrahydrodipicolinate synthase [Thermomicrobiales bacterium]
MAGTVPFPRGIFAPMCTPFVDGEVDLLRARRHAVELVRQGSHGILVAGSGGEFIAMSLEERKRLAEAVVDEGIFQAFKQSFPDSHHVRDAKVMFGDRAAVFCGHDGSAFEAL